MPVNATWISVVCASNSCCCHSARCLPLTSTTGSLDSLRSFSSDSWTARESWIKEGVSRITQILYARLRNTYIDDARVNGPKHVKFCIVGSAGGRVLFVSRYPRRGILKVEDGKCRYLLISKERIYLAMRDGKALFIFQFENDGERCVVYETTCEHTIISDAEESPNRPGTADRAAILPCSV